MGEVTSSREPRIHYVECQESPFFGSVSELNLIGAIRWRLPSVEKAAPGLIRNPYRVDEPVTLRAVVSDHPAKAISPFLSLSK